MRRPAMPVGIETEYSIFPQSDDPKLAINFNRAVNAMMRVIYNNPDWMGSQVERSYNPDIMEAIDRKEHNIRFSDKLRMGGRAYNDMQAPEACTPISATPYIAVLYDQAMMAIFQKAAEEASEYLGYDVHLLKKNSDGHGHTYGCHENYCILPQLYKELTTAPLNTTDKFNTVQLAWGTFLLTRSVLTGAGKVGVEISMDDEPEWSREKCDVRLAFQLTQRMDYLKNFRERATTKNRPLIETREEPHANKKKWQRLHYIMGDANMCETSTFLKMGLSALMLMVLQDGPRTSWTLPVLDYRKPDGTGAPKDTYPRIGQRISWDVDMQDEYDVRMASRDGFSDEVTKMSAPEILGYYIERLKNYVREREFGEDSEQKVYERVVSIADECLTQIRAGNSRALFGVLDWPTKRGICEQALRKMNKTWDDACDDPDVRRFLRGVADHAFCRPDPENSLYWSLAKDKQITRLVSDAEVREAMTTPPLGRDELVSMVIDRWYTWIKLPGTIRTGQRNIDWNIVFMDHPSRRDDEYKVKFPDPKVMVNEKMRQIVMTSKDPQELDKRLKALQASQSKRGA